MSQHTPEPWAISPKINQVIITKSDEFISIDGAIGQEAYDYYGGNLVGINISPNNAKRIVQCVNACAGMEDPAKEISDLKTQISTLQRFRIEDAASAMDDYIKLHSQFTEIRAQLDLAVKALEDIVGKSRYLYSDDYQWGSTLVDIAESTITKLKGTTT